MKKQLVTKALLSCCVIVQSSMGVSFVYNLRIAEISKRQASSVQQQKAKGPFLNVTALIEQTRKTYNAIHQNVFGGLESLIYLSKNAYARVDWGVARVSQTFNEEHFSRVQTDDILFSGGYGYSISDKTRFTFSGFFGVPTHKETAFERGIQMGVAHVGLGAQIDNVFQYSDNHALYSAVRYIRFFERKAKIPLLENRTFVFNPGNLSDLFIAHNSKFGSNRFEFGYNATFLYFPTIKPILLRIIDETAFIRSSFYVSYFRIMMLKDHPSGFVVAMSYSFDHKPKTIGLKRGFSIWGAWGINF